MRETKRTVEDSQSLSVFGLRQVRRELEALGWSGGFPVRYMALGKPVTLQVGLTTTPCAFGGVRYWFECPSCGGRV